MKRDCYILFIFIILCIASFAEATDLTSSAISSQLSGKATIQQLSMGLFVEGPPSLVIIKPYNETYLSTSIPISFIHEGGQSFWYNLNNGQNISISGNLSINAPEGGNILNLFANSSEGTTEKSVYFAVNLTKLPIYYNEYSGALKGNSTDFFSYTYERIHNISVILENTNYGKIEFYEMINLTSMPAADFDNHTNISYGRIYFNTLDLQAFMDKSAKISFYNISINDPIIVLNDAECPVSLCKSVNYSGGIFSLNFTDFNQSIRLSISPRIYFAEPTETSGSTLDRSNIQINATSLISNLKNITIRLYDSSGLVDSRAANSSSFFANFTDLDNGIYFFNATACNISNYCSSTETRNVTLNITIPAKWSEIIAPQGIFEPENSSLSGTHIHTFSIKFVRLKINSSENLECIIRLSNGSLMSIYSTGMNLMNANYSLNYTLNSDDSIINDLSAGYVPWELKNCSIDSIPSYSQDLHSRIYVHSPNYWQDGEITRAVACEGMPGVYFNNTAKCEFSKDTLFALQMRNGNPVTESCFNNQDCSASDYCKGLFFPRCETPSYFGGFSALSDDPNGYTTFNVNFASYSTQIAYTKYTNTSGTFKLRIVQALADKTFSITIYNLTNVSGANVYGEAGNGVTTISDNGDGTFNVARNRLGSGFTGTLDFVFNISFNAVQNQNRTLRIVIAYGIDTNQGNPSYFPAEFSPVYGLYNNNEAQSTSKTNELNGPCGDNVNNAFNYLGGNWANSYDCYNSDCNLYLGALQNNEFGSRSGLCNYQAEENCTDEYNNDYDSLTDCHDNDCFHNDSACPSTETICNDNKNNDWDYTNSADPIGNNGARYGVIGTLDLTDCKDADCNNSVGGTGFCNYGFETNCSDNFNNDALQLTDCQLNTLSGTTSMPSINDAEYDCSQYCRQIVSQETGALCNDNKDNDYDAIIVIGYYTGTANNSYGMGIDCRWGGYFGIGSNYNPDEDCNQTILSSGKKCELMQEKTCNDSFDNDFDSNAAGMPHAGWAANSSAYQSYFSQTFVNYADYDDYDCKSTAPTSESINAAWCFDGIDNDLDKYFFNGTDYQLNSSTGIDCADPDCANAINPSNPSQGCFAREYNSTDPSLNDSLRCNDNLDNDMNGLIDCSDLSCFKKFDVVSPGKCKNEENITWNSCADNIDNDFSDGTDCQDMGDCNGMIGRLSGDMCVNPEICDDKFDNNADGLIDCQEHASCDSQIGGRINDSAVYCRSSESTISDCFDNFDNDVDGKMDCYDESCNSACNLSTINGNTPITLPVMSSATLGAGISSYTRQIRNGDYYNLTMRMDSASSNAQWTLGTAGKPFNKTAFNISTAALTGPDSASFSLSETGNGFIISSNHAGLPSGYETTFIIKSQNVLASSTYELTYAEETNSEVSLGNYIYHEVDENIPPVVDSVQIIPDNGGVVYGIATYIRANISDNNQLGSCMFKIYGPESFNPAELIQCKASFSPTVEGIYYINVTPKDYYSNLGAEVSVQYDVNIVPSPISMNVDRTIPFYRPYELVNANASFNVVSTDSLGSCRAFAKNSSDEISLGNFAPNGNSCNANINVSSLGDGLYKLFFKATETTEGDVVESNTTALFVCLGKEGLCRYSDFNLDGIPDYYPDTFPANITIIFPPQNSQLTAGTTSTIIKISTNEIAACRYSLNKNFTFADGITFSSTNSLNHSASFAVTNNTSYRLYYKCNDTSGNINPESMEHNFSVASVPAPPIPPGPGGGGVVCTNNNYCMNLLGKGYKCRDGICVLLKTECEIDSDCNAGEYCKFGKCLPARPAPLIPSISEALSSISEFVSANIATIAEIIVIAVGVISIIGIIIPIIFEITLWKAIASIFFYLKALLVKLMR